MASQTDFARAVAYELDDLLVCTATGGSGTTAILSELINPDAQASTSRYDGHWLYGVTGALSGVQRVLTRGGLVPSTGTVTVNPGWTAPVNGTFYDKTVIFPRSSPINEAVTSYRSLMLAASRRLNISRRITVPITTSQQLSLATWDDWITAERVVGYWEPSPVSNQIMPMLDIRRPRIIEGAIPYLHFEGKPFATATGSVTLDVISPASSFVAIAGTWGESTVGLVNETDELLVSVDHMRAATLVEALTVLQKRGRTRPVGSDADDLAYWRGWCRERIPLYDFGAARQAAPAEVAA